jgi:hypothetical protein
MWKYVRPSNSSIATGGFVPNWSSRVNALNFMASLAEMAGKDSPTCQDPSISTPCNQTFCILIQTMTINSYKI